MKKQRIGVSAVADRLGVSHSGVLNLIRSCELPAINIAPARKRASYRVLVDDIDAFEERREVRPPVPRRRLAKPLVAVKQFIT